MEEPVLLEILDDLQNDKFDRFKFFLRQEVILKGKKPIPLGDLDNAGKLKVVDLMVQTYGCEAVREMTKEILMRIGRIDLVEKYISAPRESTSKSEEINFEETETLETEVYKKLEVQYKNWTWALKTSMLIIENQLYERIENGELDKVELSDLYKEMSKTYEKIKTDITRYFDGDRDKEMLAQWRGRFEIKIKELHNELVRGVKRELDEVIQQKKACKKFDDQKTEFENKLLQKSKELAHRLKEKAKDEEEIKQQFESIWSDWVRELTAAKEKELNTEENEIKFNQVNERDEFENSEKKTSSNTGEESATSEKVDQLEERAAETEGQPLTPYNKPVLVVGAAMGFPWPQHRDHKDKPKPRSSSGFSASHLLTLKLIAIQRLTHNNNQKNQRRNMTTQQWREDLKVNLYHQPLRKKSSVKTCKELLKSLLQRLHLPDKHQQKLSPADFLQLGRPVKQEHETSEEDLAHTFLQRLMMLNYRARYIPVRQGSVGFNHSNVAAVTDSKDEEDNDVTAFFGTDAVCGQPEPTHVHPMDVQMAVFHCSDSFLKQNMMTKLSQCQYALPLLVPDPVTMDVECPLWTFRQIRKTWKKTEIKDNSNIITMKSLPICKAETPMVSFFRLGSLSVSKSQLINTLINDRHNTFFHRNCPGSTKSRHLMDGVAEIAWYCPAGKPDDAFTDCTAFCNLHGDALSMKKQRDILTEKSSINIVLLPTPDKGDQRSTVFQPFLTLHSLSSVSLLTMTVLQFR
ncbi:hypothetical protein INR49_020446 [Caranx melampygus]|nr:hypothetical protein INR49_020446 [Caranx melampygus]